MGSKVPDSTADAKQDEELEKRDAKTKLLEHEDGNSLFDEKEDENIDQNKKG